MDGCHSQRHLSPSAQLCVLLCFDYYFHTPRRDLVACGACRCVRENTAGEDAFKDEDWETGSDEGEAADGADSD